MFINVPAIDLSTALENQMYHPEPGPKASVIIRVTRTDPSQPTGEVIRELEIPHLQLITEGVEMVQKTERIPGRDDYGPLGSIVPPQRPGDDYIGIVIMGRLESDSRGYSMSEKDSSTGWDFARQDKALVDANCADTLPHTPHEWTGTIGYRVTHEVRAWCGGNQ